MGMKTWILAALAAVCLGNSAYAKQAPDFSAADIEGKPVQLSALKGKIVVLEWNNPGCPFVRKFYGAGAMQQLQQDAAAKGVVWLTVNSSAPGKQGNMDAGAAKAYVAEQKAAPAHYILDPEGKIGNLYGAKTTPHMFVIDAAGNLAYAGAMDDKPSPNPDVLAGAHNYVMAAIADLQAGKPVALESTQAYGCNVKYE